MNKLDRNKIRKIMAGLLVFCLFFSPALINLSPAQGASAALALEGLDSFPPEEQIGVLVGFEETPDRELIEQHGGSIYMEYELLNTLAVKISPRSAHELSLHPQISYVELDQPVYSLALEVAELDTGESLEVEIGGLPGRQLVPWGVARVFGTEGYPFQTWEKTTGNGIGIAILDTGIYRDHEDIEPAQGVNFSPNPDPRLDYEYFDENGHGTHVAGIISALDNEIGVVGISHGSDLHAVKILDENGLGTVSSVVDGIMWAIEEEVPVINMSLYSSNYSRTLDQICGLAYEEGHLLVAAAGNLGNERGRGTNVSYPAAYDSVIAVGASNEKNERADFSSTGPQLELIAPGDDIWSTWTANNYKLYSGTSMASLHVAGAAALAWSMVPELSNEEIRTLLQLTAENLQLSPEHQGYGLVRADHAVALAVDFPQLPEGPQKPELPEMPGDPGDDPDPPREVDRGASEVIMEIGSKTVYFDDESRQMDVAPFILSGRTFVPVRFLGEAFAAQIDWEPKDSRVQTVYLQREDIQITINIGSPGIYVRENGSTRTVISDVPAFIRDGRTFLPFRAIAEAFGARVGHDSHPQTGLVTQVWFRQ